MKKYTRRLSTLSVFAALSLVAACGEKEPDPRQVELLPPAATTPTISDVPVTPPPAKTSTPPRTKAPVVVPPKSPTTPPPAPPAAPKSTFGMIPSGAEFAVLPAVKVCTNTQKVGDRITATVAETVVGSDGATIPAGATATVEVTQAVVGKNDANKVRLDFRVVSIAFGGHSYDVIGGDVVSAPVTKVRRQSNTDQAGKIAAGAAVGAVVGKVLGKSTKATVGGAVVGGLAGTAVAAGTADYDGCVAADSRLAVKLAQGLRVHVAA